jgi:serine/threonine protein kinase
MVLERMKQPFWSIVHELNPTKVAAATKKTITVGPIAARLISIVEAIHEKGYLLVDVKPDNFMFGYGSKKDTASNCAELASRLRLLDLGLVEAYKAVGAKHRPDENIADIVGTPLYASLNVHEGHTHSRRDDLEGVGYIVAELIIRLVAALNSETNEYEKGKAPSYLPWSSGNSDQAVGKSKAENVSSMNSPFFARMGQGAASHIMHEYLTTVRSLPYDGKPNYQALLNMLLPLAVEKSSIKLPRSPLRPCTVATAQPNLTPTKPSATRTSNRRKHAAEDDFEFDEDAPRHKKTIYKMDKSKPKECPAAAAIHYTEPEDMDLVPLQKKTRVKMDKSRQKEAPPAVETYEVEDMDIDVIDDSLVDEVDAAMSNVPPKKGGGAIALLVKTGPRTGEKIILNTNETETITIGSDPPQSAGILASKVQCFPDDTQMAARHLRVKLQVRLGHPRVEVSDLKSAQGTLVNSKRMDAGKSVILFPGDEIQAGTTILVVRRTV